MQDSDFRFEFSYESTSIASFITVKTGLRDSIVDYQVSMIAANNIGRIAPFGMKCSNGYAFCNYEITSMLALSFFLKRRKLMRNEFIKLLADIARTIVDSEGFLLSASSFVIDVDHVFINPETLDISLIYLPVETNSNVSDMFREFVIDLILKYADIEENDCDNFLQRILTGVKNDLLNLPAFLKLLDSLLYTVETVSVEAAACQDLQKENDLEDDEEIVKFKVVRKLSGITLVAATVLAQTVLGACVFLLIKCFRDSKYDSPANFAAIGIIAVALDVFIVKKLMQNRRVNEKDEKVYSIEVNTEKKPEETKSAVVDNTVLLGDIKNAYPVLKSRNNGDSEDIVINKPDFIIGRLAEQVDFVSKSNAVGKVHAQIISSNGVYMLKDLNSINGTFVNNNRIPSNVEQILKDGDIVAFANCEYTLAL